MIRAILFAALAATSPLPTGLAPAFQAPPGLDIAFSVSRRPDGHAQLSLEYISTAPSGRQGRSQNSGPQAWSDLEGFDPTVLDAGRAERVTFRIDRPAGDFSCSGDARDGEATGDCRFEPDADFTSQLAARTGETAQSHELYVLATSKFELATLDVLEAEGYPRPDMDQVMAVGVHRVGSDYIQGLAAAGYRLNDIDKLVGFRIHGVTPDGITDLAALGPAFQNIPANDLMSVAIHRATPEFIRELRNAGVAIDDADDAVALRIHGVTPDFIRSMAELGYRDLSRSDLLSMAIHRVTPDFIRGMASAGYRDLSARELVSLRIHGVTPDYAREMAREGVTERAVRRVR